MKIHKEGFPAITAFFFMAALTFYIGGLWSLPLWLILALLLWFFRDPERTPKGDGLTWISPADGKVVEVERIESHPVVGECVKVGIFMSPLDVHVNRVPCDCKIVDRKYVPGKKWMAFAPKASEENERCYLVFDSTAGRGMLCQIAGLLARRIVCYPRGGEELPRCQRYGIIKLGSKVDVYMPANVKAIVSVGDRLKAGESVIGVIEDEEKV